MNGSPNNSSTNTNINQRRLGERRQGIYWLGTVPTSSGWQPCLPEGISWIKGQPELGEGGFRHFQVVFSFSRKKSMAQVRECWSPIIGHWELSRSSAAEAYCWKDDTNNGERFEFGKKPFKRNSETDWAAVRAAAVAGNLESVPDDIFVRFYGSLCRIASDHVQPLAGIRTCVVFWGPTGTGKSRRAWDEAGQDCYSKDPRTKFWCGYSGQQHVIIDEFRGAIDISHLLRWIDRYPVRVEVKGGSRALLGSKFWLTSNLHPKDWYPELDHETYLALERRLIIEKIE